MWGNQVSPCPCREGGAGGVRGTGFSTLCRESGASAGGRGAGKPGFSTPLPGGGCWRGEAEIGLPCASTEGYALPCSPGTLLLAPLLDLALLLDNHLGHADVDSIDHFAIETDDAAALGHGLGIGSQHRLGPRHLRG